MRLLLANSAFLNYLQENVGENAKFDDSRYMFKLTVRGKENKKETIECHVFTIIIISFADLYIENSGTGP